MRATLRENAHCFKKQKKNIMRHASAHKAEDVVAFVYASVLIDFGRFASYALIAASCCSM